LQHLAAPCGSVALRQKAPGAAAALCAMGADANAVEDTPYDTSGAQISLVDGVILA